MFFQILKGFSNSPRLKLNYYFATQLKLTRCFSSRRFVVETERKNERDQQSKSNKKQRIKPGFGHLQAGDQVICWFARLEANSLHLRVLFSHHQTTTMIIIFCLTSSRSSSSSLSSSSSSSIGICFNKTLAVHMTTC